MRRTSDGRFCDCRGDGPDYNDRVVNPEVEEEEMIEKLKDYVLTIAVQKYLPTAMMAGMAALGTYLAAHSGVLEQYGVTYGIWPLHWAAGQDPSGPCILVELDTLSTAAITAIVGLVAIVIRASQHHLTGSTVPPTEEKPQ
jgi:hypothetical protein